MKHIYLFFGFSLWEAWLGKTKKIVANSSWELIFWVFKRLFMGNKTMEKELVQGSKGDVKLTISAGKIRIEASGKLESAGGSAGAFIEEDAGALLDKIFAAIEAKSPAGAVPIEEGVKTMLKEKLLAL